jgi:hypothetical protein
MKIWLSREMKRLECHPVFPLKGCSEDPPPREKRQDEIPFPSSLPLPPLPFLSLAARGLSAVSTAGELLLLRLLFGKKRSGGWSKKGADKL